MKNLFMLAVIAMFAVASVSFITGCSRDEEPTAPEAPPVNDTHAHDDHDAQTHATPAVAEPVTDHLQEQDTTPAVEPDVDAEEPVEIIDTSMMHFERAAADGKYLLALFYDNPGERTMKAIEAFKTSTAAFEERANSAVIDVTDPAQQKIVFHFNVQHAPKPIMLSIAPNGAVIAGVPGTIDEEIVASVFATPSQEKALKSLQSGKLVLFCVLNAATSDNDEAMQGVNDFASDEQFAEVTDVITVDPTSETEREFLDQLDVSPDVAKATVLFLAPPGRLIARFSGATTRNDMLGALHRAFAGGCGPVGCP